jgi:hypothetical protein
VPFLRGSLPTALSSLSPPSSGTLTTRKSTFRLLCSDRLTTSVRRRRWNVSAHSRGR